MATVRSKKGRFSKAGVVFKGEKGRRAKDWCGER